MRRLWDGEEHMGENGLVEEKEDKFCTNNTKGSLGAQTTKLEILRYERHFLSDLGA